MSFSPNRRTPEQFLFAGLVLIALLALLRGVPSQVDLRSEGKRDEFFNKFQTSKNFDLRARIKRASARLKSVDLEDGFSRPGPVKKKASGVMGHVHKGPERFVWSRTVSSEVEGEGEEAARWIAMDETQREAMLLYRSNTSGRMAEELHKWQVHMSQAREEEDTAGGAGYSAGRVITRVGLQALQSTAFILNRAMFEVYSAGRKRSHLRYYVDLPARLDNDGTRDALRKAKCVMHSPNKTYGSSGRRRGVRSITGGSCLVRYMFPRGMLPLLPESDSETHFTSCAIVGNSGSLLSHQHGREIDQHQAVIRINSPPTEGWEKYVGSRTTFNLCNHYHATHIAGVGGKQLADHDRQEVRHYRTTGRAHRRNVNETLVLFEATLYRAYYKLYIPLFEKLPPPRTAVLSPDFVTAMSELWAMLQHTVAASDSALGASIHRNSAGICHAHQLPENSNSTCARPLTGWYAVLFGIRLCDRVDVYGFDRDYKKDDKTIRHPYHYYDEAEGETGTHSFDLTMRILEILKAEFKNLYIH